MQRSHLLDRGVGVHEVTRLRTPGVRGRLMRFRGCPQREAADIYYVIGLRKGEDAAGVSKRRRELAGQVERLKA